MDSRKIISEYIAPSKSKRNLALVFAAIAVALFAAGGICLYFAMKLGYVLFLFGVFSLGACFIFAPAYNSAVSTMKKSLKRLEELGQLDSAAAELNAEDIVRIDGDNSRLSANFAFRRGSGAAVCFEDVIWTFLIPNRDGNGNVHAMDVVTNTRSGQSFTPVSVSVKEPSFVVQEAYELIASRCPNAITDYNEENRKEYRAMLKQIKKDGKASAR